MPLIPGRIQLGVKEAGYLAYHVGWNLQPAPQLQARIALDDDESGLDTGNIRPASENGAGGIDWGFEMENDVNGPFPAAKKRGDPGEPNPARFLEPLFSLRKSLAYAKANPTTPFKPWNYGYPGAPRSDADIELADISAQIGPLDELYVPANSPYWRMVEANIPVEDLPVPPAGVYVSGLPQETLVFGNHGGADPTGPTHGASINLLQLRLQEIGLYPFSRDQWFGGKTQTAVRELQTTLMTCRLYSGLIHGNYDRATRLAWDGSLRFSYLSKGR